MCAHGFVGVAVCGFEADLLPAMRQAGALTMRNGRPAIVDYYEFEDSAWNALS